ncbi:MAG: HlyD family efflux transporter periplasmic adaptor subunit [Myxococcota bacterium]
MSPSLRARPFTDTLPSVGRSRWGSWGALGVLLIALWAWIAAAAPLPRYEPSLAGRLEVEGHPVVLRAAHAGRVERVAMQLEQRVEAGELIVRLDTSDLAERRERIELRRTGLRSSLVVKRRELASARQQIEYLSQQQQARHGELEIEREARQAAAELAQRRARRVDRLAQAQAGSAEEVEQVRAEEAIARLDVKSIRRSGRSTEAEFKVRRAELDMRVASLESDIVELETTLASTEIDLETNGREIDEHAIKAPRAGRLSRVAPLTVGSLLEAGAELTVIVPERPPVVRARFSSHSAAGRLRAGQRARVRFDAFSWIEYGSVDAVVAAVGDEAVDGAIEVELELVPSSNTAIPIHHGLVCTVDVEIEQTTLLRTLARAIGLVGQPAAELPRSER